MGFVVEVARAWSLAQLHPGGVPADQDPHLLQAQFPHLEYGARSYIIACEVSPWHGKQ